MKALSCALLMLPLLLTAGCSGDVSGGQEENASGEEPVIDAGTDAGDLTDSSPLGEVDLSDAGDPGWDEQPSADESEPADDAGAEDGGDSGLTCLSGSTPALLTVSATQLHTELETKDFLLINVAGAPSIAKTDTIIDYSNTDALVAFIGANLKTRVVLYCQSGGRSSVAGNALVARGYCSIRHLSGGKSAWTQAGYPLE
jgi:rhodanese-related sulfurtransferase